jgi:hypothetical protein
MGVAGLRGGAADHAGAARAQGPQKRPLVGPSVAAPHHWPPHSAGWPCAPARVS